MMRRMEEHYDQTTLEVNMLAQALRKVIASNKTGLDDDGNIDEELNRAIESTSAYQKLKQEQQQRQQ